MKKIIFLSLIISLIIGGCNQVKKSRIEGAWQLVYSHWPPIDGIFPTQIKGGSIKIWSMEYFATVGRFEMDTVIYDTHVGGTYKLEGNRYQETIHFNPSKGTTDYIVRLILELRNDTLIQRWPADENWNLDEKFSTEKYVRLK